MRVRGSPSPSRVPADSSCPLRLRDVPPGPHVALLPGFKFQTSGLTRRAAYNSPAHNPGKRARPQSPGSPTRRNLVFRSDVGRSPFNDSSHSRRSHDGGSNRSHGSSPSPDWVDAEIFMSTLAPSGMRRSSQGSTDGFMPQGLGCKGHRSAKDVAEFGAAHRHPAAHLRFR